MTSASEAFVDVKDQLIRVRVTAEQERELSAAATRAGVDVSTWIRVVVALREARATSGRLFQPVKPVGRGKSPTSADGVTDDRPFTTMKASTIALLYDCGELPAADVASILGDDGTTRVKRGMDGRKQVFDCLSGLKKLGLVYQPKRWTWALTSKGVAEFNESVRPGVAPPSPKKVTYY